MSERARPITGAADRGDGEDAARAAKLRRSAWRLAALAAFFYVGFIVWTMFRTSGGG